MADNNIDDLFKQGLSGHTEQPSDKVWAGIEGSLNAPVSPNYSRLLILLLLLIFGAGAGYLIYELQGSKAKVAELTKEISDGKKESKGPLRVDSERATEVHLEPEAIKSIDGKETSSSGKIQPSMSTIELQSQEVNSRYSTGNEPSRAIVPNEASSSPILDEMQQVRISNGQLNLPGAYSEYGTSSKMKEKLADEETAIQNIMLTPISSLISEFEPIYPEFDGSGQLDYYEPKSKMWILSGYHIASFNYRRINSQSSVGDDLIDVLNEAEMSAIDQGLGMALTYELNGKWRFGLGLEYLERTQESTYIVGFEATDITSIPNPATGSGWSLSQEVNSSYGQIEIDISNLNDLPDEINFAGLPNGSFESQLVTKRLMKVLRVPITTEYLVQSGRWTFAIGGGLAYNRVSSNETTYSLEGLDQTDTGQSNLVSESNSNLGNYLSLHGGVAVEWGLAERLKLRINPGYESWLSPIYSDENLKTLPYSFSVRTGILYILR